MSRPIISINDVSKRYILRHSIGRDATIRGESGLSLRNTVADALHSVTRRFRPNAINPRLERSEFWALRDVSFDVERGKVVGLIGRNGAGKSTMLKILSRIVDPSAGSIHLRGRVASLLEVGTGFHPELSGRENIYLNGAILGMKRAEIRRKFDEIVAFSEIEKFLDTPVKRYSSGMFVRLAFAVAAHLEPEILIVDEVLAVGDYAFQKKCLGKMRDVASGDGRTVLFVSHNMGALSQLCDDGVLLEDGQVTMIGPVEAVVKKYMKTGVSENAAFAEFDEDAAKDCQFLSVEILHADGGHASDFSCDEPIQLRFQYKVRRPISESYLTFYLQNQEGTRVLYSDIRDLDPETPERLGVGVHTFNITIPARLLGATTYLLTVGSAGKYAGVIDHHYDCCEFTLRDLAIQDQSRPGVLGIQLPWKHDGATLAEVAN
ncbi:MAG: ABC transporter ATP-binding protein [Paludisphaera borealis]|uniref:ABC transporter ATP-binding protein n=1 Tax=Paludisphaera borealis TaxID=1387353 RepID=UPI00285200B4|nr:ABC transporter ATP-binding protein [Paludisphaera borealis]MDR3622639.1 ABC transporter ATP-binding protein [Paludisphaera borealis]